MSNFDRLLGQIKQELRSELVDLLIDLSTGNNDRPFLAKSAQIGDSTNYSEFEEDGTYKANGDATTYDDLPPVPIISQKLGGAGADPTFSTFVGNTKLYTFAVNDLVPGLQSEVTHKYKEGSDITIHIHWATNGTDATDTGVKWQVEYTIANGNSDEAFSGTTTVSAEATVPADTTDRTHYITGIGTIDGTNIKIGSYIVAAVSRITATGTAPASDPFCIALGYHVEQDTIGSRQTFIK